MKPIPLLIWSDTPCASSGLARITRELCSRIATCLPEFKIATVGYGGPGSSKLPFFQYAWSKQDSWVLNELPEIWADWTQGEPGILWVIQDAARVGWLGQYDNPELTCPISDWYRKMRAKKLIKTWGYFPVDAAGPNGKLAYPLKQTLLGFDRVLNYSKWANGIVRNSGIDNTDWLPHGINGNIWAPRNPKVVRDKLGLTDEHYLIGIIGTNQWRKDWALGIRTAAVLRDKFKKKVVLWCHTDALERYWSLPVLLLDYGFATPEPMYMVTSDFTDDQLAHWYSACQVVLGIGRGEGFSFCNAEALACGVPICCHAYSGYSEWVPDWMQVAPEMFTYEGTYCELRPIGVPEVWADHIMQYSNDFSGICLPPQLEWSRLWPRWKDWLLRGIR